MKNILLAFLLFESSFLLGQHTFSIVAVDTITGEVGSAGATCLSVDREGYQALIISDVIPGKGAIHTQAYWHSVNQLNARQKVLEGLNGSQTIQWLIANDVQRNPTIRQYGIALFDSLKVPNAAGHTGVNCDNEKKHVSKRFYSIQGNILIGNYVIDSMEARFLRAKGSLADRLMESMLGALIPGADERCLPEGLSSRSSFIRVAKPTDSENNLYLDINVASVTPGVDPIDSLHTLYKNWKQTTGTLNKIDELNVSIYFDDNDEYLFVKMDQHLFFDCKLSLYTLDGKPVFQSKKLLSNRLSIPHKLPVGVYVAELSWSSNNHKIFRKQVKLNR
ncbi:MAG: DUF1028 domain-containing protein [Bacteroidota bacterium]|nr:DUF1028 domain-containing protein [Bacteroidota bacterium]